MPNDTPGQKKYTRFAAALDRSGIKHGTVRFTIAENADVTSITKA